MAEIRAVNVASGREVQLCTGVLVDGGVVTAAHCAGPGYRDYRVIFRSASGEQAFTFERDPIVPNPVADRCKRMATSGRPSQAARDDVGFIRLAERPLDILPARLGDASAGEFGTAVGYGNTTELSGSDMQRRRADVTISSTADGTLSALGGSSGTICGGDSGGALFAGNGCASQFDVPTLWGVISRSSYCGEPTTPITAPHRAFFGSLAEGSSGRAFVRRMQSGSLAGRAPECCPYTTARCGTRGSKRCNALGRWGACCERTRSSFEEEPPPGGELPPEGETPPGGEPGGEGESCSTVRCGDGVCDESEDDESCVEDCGPCGDGVCNTDENCATCWADCPCTRGTCDASQGRCIEANCGDGVCAPTENCSTCASDCYCGSGYECSSISLRCEPMIVGFCGDGRCTSGENEHSCCHDCGCSHGASCRCSGCPPATGCAVQFKTCEPTGVVGACCRSDDDCSSIPYGYCDMYHGDYGTCDVAF